MTASVSVTKIHFEQIVGREKNTQKGSKWWPNTCPTRVICLRQAQNIELVASLLPAASLAEKARKKAKVESFTKG